MKTYWSPAEDAHLVALYPGAPYSQILNALPGRSADAVRARATKTLGLVRGGGCAAEWAVKEDAVLSRLWRDAPQPEIMSALPGRTYDAIKRRAHVLGLPRRYAGRVCQPVYWNAERNDLLASAYWSGTREELLSLFPGQTWRAVSHRAEAMGLRRRHRRQHQAFPASVAPQPFEIWRQVRGFGRYWISTSGRFAGPRGLHRVQDRPDRCGFASVKLWSASGRSTTVSVAVLVLSTFVGAPVGRNSHPTLRDGDRSNLSLENLYWALKPGNRSARPKAPPKPPVDRTPLGERLRRSLAANDAYAAASRALPGTIRGDMRDDIIADMVVAHLGGELDADAFKARSPEFIRAYNRDWGGYGQVSLDATIPGTDDLRLSDVLSDTEYHERWAALG